MNFKKICCVIMSGCLAGAVPNVDARSADAVELGRIESLYAQTALDPFAPDKVDEYVAAVHENRTHWLDSVGGRKALKRADKLLAINSIKQRLDACLGYDTLSRDASRKIVLAAARADTELCVSTFIFPVAVRDLNNLANLFGERKIADAQQYKNLLVFLTFRNMSEKALNLERRWKSLLKEVPRNPSLMDRICEKKGCDEGQRAVLTTLEKSAMYNSNALLLKYRNVDEAVTELQGEVDAMARDLYSPDRSYHISHAKDVAGSFRWQSYRASPNLGSDQANALLTRFGSGLTRNPLPTTYDQAPAETLDRLNREISAQLPDSFRTAQGRVNDDALAELLSRGRTDWQNALSFGQEPRAVPTPGRTYEVRTGQIEGEGRVKITAKEILSTHAQQMDLVASKLREVATFQHDAQKAAFKGKKVDYDDMLKKLVVAAPDAVGAALLTVPALADILCRTLKQIAKDQTSKELKEWALLGATITSTIATGGFAAFGRQALASASGAALAASTAAEAVSSMKEGLDTQAISEFQQSQCYTASATDASCSAARESLQKAVASYSTAGFAAAGALPFTSAVARLSRGSVGALNGSLKRLPDVAKAIKEMGSALSIRLGTGGTAELAAALSTARADQLSAIVKNVRGMNEEGREAFLNKLGSLKAGRQCAL